MWHSTPRTDFLISPHRYHILYICIYDTAYTRISSIRVQTRPYGYGRISPAIPEQFYNGFRSPCYSGTDVHGRRLFKRTFPRSLQNRTNYFGYRRRYPKIFLELSHALQNYFGYRRPYPKTFLELSHGLQNYFGYSRPYPKM